MQPVQTLNAPLGASRPNRYRTFHMKPTRFSITLYISLPVLLSACSVVMIAHFVQLVEGRITEVHVYGDLLAFTERAEGLRLPIAEPLSYEWLAPLIAGGLAALFSIEGLAGTGLVAGSFNFLYLLGGFGWMYYLSLKDPLSSALEVSLPPFLILSLPAFWSGIFLPVSDALMFFFSATVLVAVIQRRPLLLALTALLSVLVSEWMLAAVLFVPLVDLLRRSPWIKGYVAWLPALALWALLPLLFQTTGSHPVYDLPGWAEHIAHLHSESQSAFWRLFLQSFGLVIGFLAWRWYDSREHASMLIYALWLLTVFLLGWLLTADLVFRFVLMLMPSLVLLQYRIFVVPGNVDHTLKVASRVPVSNGLH